MTDPCGTPLETDIASEIMLLILTSILRFLKKSTMKLGRLPFNPNW